MPASRALCLSLLATVAPAAAQPLAAGPARPRPAASDVLVGGRSVVGRWLALDVAGDAEASRDLASGALEKVLVVNPGGHVILRGTDRVHGQGASFSGRLFGDVLAFQDLPGVARLALDGRRLVLTDPAGRRTRFVRLRDGR